MRLPSTTIMTLATICIALVAPVCADEAISFKGKTITMIIPTTAGASTDLSGRLFAKFFSKHLPGAPASISQNIPAGHGIVALNFLTQQSKPDGLTLSMSSSSQVDPITYRSPLAKYDPAEMQIIGSVGAGDTASLALSALCKGGKLVLVGLFGGEIALSIGGTILRAITVRGSHLGSVAELKEVIALARAGKINPIPIETRPLADVSRTLDELKAGAVVGRVVAEI